MSDNDPRTKYDDEIWQDLKAVATHFDREDRAVRERQIRIWKKLEYYWAGYTRVWWSEVAHDWRVDSSALQDQTVTEGGYYDKPINIFRSFLESIIAALTVSVPGIRCIPDDADNPDDVLTAMGGDKIAELVYKHIDAPLLFVRALFLYCTQGMIAAHNYTIEDESFGVVEHNEFKDTEIEEEVFTCPLCNAEFGPEDAAISEAIETAQEDKFDPSQEDVEFDEMGAENEEEENEDGKEHILCPNCSQSIAPNIIKKTITVPRFVGITHEPKSRQRVDVYGGLNVKVPNYARKQEDCPYLKLSYESHFTTIVSKWPWMFDRLRGEGGTSNKGAMYDPYERWGRLNTQYHGEYPLNTPTVSMYWFRPCAFSVLPEERAEKLQELFPDGCRYVQINDEGTEVENEKFDDHWTLTYNPLSNYIHFDPLGMMVTSIQEITDDIISLTLQTIEHGIPQTFADPRVLNFEAYRQSEITVGGIFPAKPPSGQPMGNGFYEVRTATLSQEVQPFAQKIFDLGQFVSGALPSLWGGEQSSGSKTAAQYAMSRAQSLQRLQTPWKMLCYWWKNIFSKVIPAYIKDMLEDEKYVKKVGNNYINIVIRRAELQGKIGDFEAEASEQLPMSLSQMRDVVTGLIQMAPNVPQIAEVLTLPENVGKVSQILGVTGLHVPGQDDKEKQLDEIKLLLGGNVTSNIDQMTGQPIENSSIQIEPLIDDHVVHAETVRSWAVSEAGRQAKNEIPEGYKNVLLHLQEHIQFVQSQQAAGPGQNQEPTGTTVGVKKNARQQAESTV